MFRNHTQKYKVYRKRAILFCALPLLCCSCNANSV